MGTYVIRRILLAIPTVFVTLLLIFFMLRVLPGDAATAMLMGSTQGSQQGEIIPKATRDAVLKDLGLDKPISTQFVVYFWNVFHGDLGRSIYTNRSVWFEIGQRVPISLQVSLVALFMGLAFGIPIGVITAIKQDSIPDYLLRFFTILLLAIPSFWLGLMVLLIGAFVFNWMAPVGQHYLWVDPIMSLKQTMWPSLILASHSTAVTARMTRSTMLEVLREDYIRTARAKGLREQVVITRHALRNSLIPVVTLAGLSFGNLLAGTVILEKVFTIPGMGLLFINAIDSRDYAVVQAVVLIIAVSYVVVNLAVDLLYGWLDPRISYAN